MNFEIGDLVEMKPALESTWLSKTKYYGLGLITKVGATTCAVDWIRIPWGGIEQLRGIDKELLRKVE